MFFQHQPCVFRLRFLQESFPKFEIFRCVTDDFYRERHPFYPKIPLFFFRIFFYFWIFIFCVKNCVHRFSIFLHVFLCFLHFSRERHSSRTPLPIGFSILVESDTPHEPPSTTKKIFSPF